MFGILIAMLAQVPPPPGAPPPLHSGTMEITCPVGGERFTARTVPVYSTTGQRPDGKPYSEVPFPLPIAQCPGNGLVIFDDYTPAETAQLAKWIATPTYRAMRNSESPFYLAYWLAEKIGRPKAEALNLLLPAIWSAKDKDGKNPKRPRAARYQRVLVDAAREVPDSVRPDDRIWFRGLAANALREMGDFAAAEQMRRLAASEIESATIPALATYLQQLKAVIARRDRGDEPLDMIPDVQAAIACKANPPKTSFERIYCAKPSIATLLD